MDNRANDHHSDQDDADVSGVTDLIEEVSIDGMCGVY
jgi:mycofactocin precursor